MFELQQLKGRRRSSLSHPTVLQLKSKRRGSYSDPEVHNICLNNNGFTNAFQKTDIQINIELVPDKSDKTVKEKRSSSGRRRSSGGRSQRNSLTGGAGSRGVGGATVSLSKSFNQSDNISLRPEQEMVTLFKARSHSDIQDAIIPGVKDTLKNDREYQKQSATSLFKSQLPTATSTHVTFRSRESLQSELSRNGLSMLSISCSRSMGDCDVELSSLAQLLDVVGDLERVHAAYNKMEMERKRDTLHNILDSSFSDLLNTSEN